MGMNTKDTEETNDSANIPEDIDSYTVLQFTGLPKDVDTQKIVLLIKGTDILSVERVDESLYVSFFSYFDLFYQWKALGDELSIGEERVKVQPVRSNLPKDVRERAYLAHAAGGTRNIMLSGLEDFMNGEFIREEAEKFGVVESLKHIKERKIAYVEFYSFISAMEFVVILREDSLFQNVKISFGKDKCGTGENDDVAVQNKRTIYFGNIPNDTTPSEILSFVKGGPVYTVKVIRDKKCAFVGFFNYISAAAFIEYSQIFAVSIRGMHAKLGPGKIQPLPHIAPVLAYKGVTRSILFKTDRTVNETKLEFELSRYGEIDKIERKESDLVRVSYLNAQDAYTAYEALRNDPTFGRMLNGYAVDPCSEVTTTDLMLEIQRKEFMA